MNAPAEKNRFSRRTALKGGALIVGFALAGRHAGVSAQGVTGAVHPLDAKEVDAYLAVNADGTVTVYCGKVDLGQGCASQFPR
jgi:nicotinate dehydrogenase subunit B